LAGQSVVRAWVKLCSASSASQPPHSVRVLTVRSSTTGASGPHKVHSGADQPARHADRSFDGNALPDADRHEHGGRALAELVLDGRRPGTGPLHATQFRMQSGVVAPKEQRRCRRLCLG
jgi:hypothetical protein